MSRARVHTVLIGHVSEYPHMPEVAYPRRADLVGYRAMMIGPRGGASAASVGATADEGSRSHPRLTRGVGMGEPLERADQASRPRGMGRA